jgi:nitroimidazol reductase NimA-like FMN-containing flavoprotein (pyridoxamine 5'-phosphate oxidase superfamily)
MSSSNATQPPIAAPADPPAPVSPTAPPAARVRELAHKAIASSSFCTLATSSPDGRPHVAGVLYAWVNGSLYVSTFDDSRKARNVRENARVAICVPVRKLPFGPPYSIQFQATAEVVPADDPAIRTLIARGRFKKILAHGVLENPKTIFLRVTPGKRANVSGLGFSLRQIIRNPTAAVSSVDL